MRNILASTLVLCLICSAAAAKDQLDLSSPEATLRSYIESNLDAPYRVWCSGCRMVVQTACMLRVATQFLEEGVVNMLKPRNLFLSFSIIGMLACGTSIVAENQQPEASDRIDSLHGPGSDQLSQSRLGEVSTYTYKTVGDLEIKADVLRSDDQELRPVVVWIHGGALINGGRQGVGKRIREMMVNAGYVIVSIDYRLAPETKLAEIIADLEDAFTWIHRYGPSLFKAKTERIAVMGGSAGGYLTLTSGFRSSPKPTVLVSFYGYGDLVGDWYSKPSKHARHQRKTMNEAELAALLAGPPVANSGDRLGDGRAFYQYCRQNGLWPEMVSGFDPHTHAQKYDPFMPVRNVSAEYPPTLLIHGTEDTDVPYEQSLMMAEQLEKQGIEHRLIAIPGAEHGLGGGDPGQIDAAYDMALKFVNDHMKRK